MKTETMPETKLLEDAQLVELCRGGNREAYGAIVARYQSIIYALAFSACGDMDRSEDLAQEIFINAWRNLAQLREPGRLKAWLCGIARNTINYSFREQARNPIAASEPIEDEFATLQSSTPPEEAMTKEEAAILWRVLEALPRAYRDPMVLFYRHDESTAEVAEALEISEEAVRQRLTRGRTMLNERVAKLVESGLRRTTPSEGFSSVVVAALPALAMQAGAGGFLATAAKGTGGVKAAGILGTILSLVTSVLPGIAGFFALWGWVNCSRSARERRFVIVTSIGLLVWAGALIFGALATFPHRPPQVARSFADAVATALVWLAFCGPLDAYAIWAARRQRQIRIEQGAQDEYSALGFAPGDVRRKGFKMTAYGSIAALIGGTTGWLIIMSSLGKDWVTTILVMVLAVGGWLAVGAASVRKPEKFRHMLIWLAWGLLLLNLLVANLRWGAWVSKIPIGLLPTPFAPLGINLLIVVFFASIRIGWFLKEKMLSTQEVRPWVVRSLTAYVLILLVGGACFKIARTAEGPPPVAIQATTNEIQPDGTIRFVLISETPNLAQFPVRQSGLYNSDFVHVQKMFDQTGKPLAFTATHKDQSFEYNVTYNEPVPPGKTLYIKMEGTVSGQIHPLSTPGEYEFREQHWPGMGMDTRRIEVYRLSPGAEVLETKPAGLLSSRILTNGVTELRCEKLIPPGGKIELQFRYRLSQR
jgi:RNA polymerase sigma factor (sigma-70 family)